MGRKPGSKDKQPRKSSPYSVERRLAQGSELRACEVCGAEFWVSRAQREKIKGGGRFCSRACKYAGSTAHKQRRSAEVTRHSAGYLLQWAPDHPRANHGRVLQHILILEDMLGRPLADDEEAHHVNGVRDDNRPENLQVTRKGVHQAMHWTLPEFRARQRERRLLDPQPTDPVTGRFIPR